MRSSKLVAQSVGPLLPLGGGAVTATLGGEAVTMEGTCEEVARFRLESPWSFIRKTSTKVFLASF